MGQSPEELRRDIEATRMDLGQTIDTIGDRVSPRRIVDRRTERIREGFGSMRDRVMGTPARAMSSAGDAATSVAGSASDLASSAADTVRSVPERAMHGAEGNPFAAGMIAFGAGLLVATLLPATEVEAQAGGAVREKLEPLKETALEMGHEVASDLQQSAHEAAGELKDHARQATEEVKANAADAAREVKSEAKTSG